VSEDRDLRKVLATALLVFVTALLVALFTLLIP